MYEIRVTVTIDAPAEEVFNRVSDHERFLRGPDMTCRLVTEGRGNRNGLGAVREVATGGSLFTEEVTAFDPPRYYEYRVRRLIDRRGRAVRMLHELGRIQVTPQGDAACVEWLSRFSVTMPVIGWFVERIVGPRAARGFRGLLEQAKADLEAQREAATAVVR